MRSELAKHSVLLSSKTVFIFWENIGGSESQFVCVGVWVGE